MRARSFYGQAHVLQTSFLDPADLATLTECAQTFAKVHELGDVGDSLVRFKELVGISQTIIEFNGLIAKSLQPTRNVQLTKVHIAAPWLLRRSFP